MGQLSVFKPLWIFVLVLGIPVSAIADTVEIKGGDRLTGSVVKLEEGKLIFKTAYAADPIAIAFDQVTSLTLSHPMILTTAKGKQVTSALKLNAHQVEVSSPAGAVLVETAGVKTLRSEHDQAVYEKTLHPAWDRGWAVNANASFALAQGNAQTESIGAGATALRATHNDKTTANFSTLYTRDNKAGVTTAQSTGGSLRYDRNVTPRVFTYGETDFLTNGLQNLDLRSILSSGFGWHTVKQKEQTLDIFGGGAWTREHYFATSSALASTNNFAAIDFGESWSRKLGKPSAFSEKATFYPNMNQRGNYELQVAAGITSKLTRLLNWHVNITDNYTSFPPVGTLANDMVLTTGIGITLARP